jgi:hypothetical protein
LYRGIHEVASFTALSLGVRVLTTAVLAEAEVSIVPAIIGD